jgi:DNA-binding transcriptional ArsR family regulator
MNMKSRKAENRIADYLKVLGSPFRIKILFNIGYGEACVCHLETVLMKRQAYISQHLMVLRDAGILDTRRDGKYIFYRVADKTIFEMLHAAAGVLNIPLEGLPDLTESPLQVSCDCPKCQNQEPNQSR